MNRRLTPSIACCWSASLLGACQTTDPYTGQQQTSNTAKGAGIGAAAGAVIGACCQRYVAQECADRRRHRRVGGRRCRQLHGRAGKEVAGAIARNRRQRHAQRVTT